MDVLKQIKRLELLMEKAEADNAAGMVVYYRSMIKTLREPIQVGRISESVKTRIAS